MIHPMLKQRGDAGFVVAADVISEKELKGCFVSQTMSLKLSSFFKKEKKIRFYPKADVPNPKPLIQACWRPLAWSSAGAGRRLLEGNRGGRPAHRRACSGVMGPRKPSFAADLLRGPG